MFIRAAQLPDRLPGLYNSRCLSMLVSNTSDYKERRFACLFHVSLVGAKVQTSNLPLNGGERQRLADLVRFARRDEEHHADGNPLKSDELIGLAEECNKRQGLAKYGADPRLAVELGTCISSGIQTEIPNLGCSNVQQ